LDNCVSHPPEGLSAIPIVRIRSTEMPAWRTRKGAR